MKIWSRISKGSGRPEFWEAGANFRNLGLFGLRKAMALTKSGLFFEEVVGSNGNLIVLLFSRA